MTDVAQTMDVTLERPEAKAAASGARSGALLAGASAVSIVANYVFLLAAGRLLGSGGYGSLAALLGLLAVVLMPAGALQMAVSREVSRRVAAGDVTASDALVYSVMRVAAIATVPLLVVALALAAPLSDVLHIHNVGLVALSELTLVTALIAPVALGVVQGVQRFHALAATSILPVVLRLVAFAIAAAAGYRLGGAIVANFLSSVAVLAVAVALVREPLARGRTLARPDLGPFLRYLWPVTAGLIGIALLTHVDILVVKARLSADDAGAYAAASAFARVGFFLPATILAVLFPRTAARQARGEQTEDILGRSLLVTAAFCAAIAVFYAAAGVGLVTATFGRGFAAGGDVLAPFALAIGFYSLAYILVGYHLSRGETRYAWIVVASVVAQVAALTLVPATLHAVVWANFAVGAGLLVGHELLVGSSASAVRAGVGRAYAATARLRAVLPETALVLVGTTAFVCLLFIRVVEHLGSTIIGQIGSDSTGSVSFFWLLDHESGYHLLGSMHHTLTGAPFGWDQGNGLNLQWMLPYYPGYLATKLFGPVAAFNLVVLSGYVLTGASLYLLTRYLGCGRLAAAWAAFVGVIFPWHLARAEHASLVHVEVLVLLVFALVAASRRPSWLRFAVVGIATLACWLTSGYFGAMAVVSAIAFTVGVAVTNRTRRSLLLVGGAAGASIAASILILIAAVVSGTNGNGGLHRAASDLTSLGLRPLELVVPTAGSIVFGHALQSFWAHRLHGSNETEIANYAGLLTVALAIGWLVVAIRRRTSLSPQLRIATAGLVSTFVVGFLFALPSPITVFGASIAMPARLLWEATSGFRVPSRWDPLLLTALIPLAALGLEALRRRVGRSAIAAVAVVGAAAAISFVELAVHPAAHRFRTVPVPPEYAALKDTPQGILAEYPLGYSDIYGLWQQHHGRPLVNNAPPDTQADYARLVLLDPTQPGTAEALSLLGVTAIEIHPGAHVDAEVPPGDPAHTPGYRLVGRFPDGASVWDVVAPAAPAFVTLAGGFAKPMVEQGGLVVYPLTSPSGVAALQVRSRTGGVVRLVFEARPPSGKTITLRVSDGRHEQAFPISKSTQVSALVDLPRGTSQLLLKTEPAPTSEADALLLSAPRAQTGTGKPSIVAQLLSPDPGF